MTIYNTFQVYTGGYRFEYEKITNVMRTLGFSVDSKDYFLKTPLVTLNPNYLFNFMSWGQFMTLPDRTFAKSCKIKVTPLGYRLPFATNKTTSGYANSQLVVQIGSCVGLDTTYNILSMPYAWTESDATKPVVTSEKTPTGIIQALWGGADLDIVKFLQL